MEFITNRYIFNLNSNETFLEQGGLINMTTPLQNNFFSDIPDYMVTVSLISDQWGMYFHAIIINNNIHK